MPIREVKKAAYVRAGAIVLFSFLLVGMIWWMAHNKTKYNFSSEVVPVKIKTKIGFLPITDHLVLGVSMARDAGQFKQLDLSAEKFIRWADIADSLKAGEIDGAILLAPLAFRAKLDGAAVKIVLLTHRDGSALIARVREGINTMGDLNGKTIAIPHTYSTHNFLLHLCVSKEGLIPGVDFKTVILAPSDMPSALTRGEIDGYIVAEPFGAKAEVQGTGKVLAFSKDIWKHHPDCVLVVREDYLNAHPEAVQELVTSLINSGIFTEENRDEAIKIGAEFLGHEEEEIAKALKEPIDRVTFYDLTPNLEEFYRIQDYMREKMGLFSEVADLDELVDVSYAEKAYDIIGKTKRR